MMHKKSQVGSRIFIFIVMIIVFPVVLLFGYRSIGTISEKGEQVRLIQLRTKLRHDITSLASQYGSVDINEYELPLNIGELCFVDLSENNIGKGISVGLRKKWPIIADQIEGGTKNSLFLFDEQVAYIDSLDVGRLDIKGPGWVCYKNENGRFTLGLEGRGDGTELREDFIVEDELTATGVTLGIEEIDGLEVRLEPSIAFPLNTYVRLIVEKGNDPEKLTDNYIIEIFKKEVDGTEGDPGPIIFIDSYIKIPVSDCRRAGEWGDIECNGCCSNNIARYDITKI